MIHTHKELHILQQISKCRFVLKVHTFITNDCSRTSCKSSNRLFCTHFDFNVFIIAGVKASASRLCTNIKTATFRSIPEQWLLQMIRNCFIVLSHLCYLQMLQTCPVQCPALCDATYCAYACVVPVI